MGVTLKSYHSYLLQPSVEVTAFNPPLDASSLVQYLCHLPVTPEHSQVYIFVFMQLYSIAMPNHSCENTRDERTLKKAGYKKDNMITIWMASLITTSFTWLISMKVVLSFPEA